VFAAAVDIDASVVDSRCFHLDRANARVDRASAVVPVADDQAVAVLISLVDVGRDVRVDLGFERYFQHPLRSETNHLGKRRLRFRAWKRESLGSSVRHVAYLPRVGASWCRLNNHQGTPRLHALIHNFGSYPRTREREPYRQFLFRARRSHAVTTLQCVMLAICSPALQRGMVIRGADA